MNWSPSNVVTAAAGRLRTTKADGPFACHHCEHRFDQNRQVCPHCGGHCIERTEWPALGT